MHSVPQRRRFALGGGLRDVGRLGLGLVDGPGAVELGVVAAAGDELVVGAELGEAAVVHDADAVGAGAAVDNRCATTIVVRPCINFSIACSTWCSVPGSRLEVASSSTSTDGSASAARASDTSWRSPADNRRPRSRTSVSRPSGNARKRSRRPSTASALLDVVVGGLRPADADVVAQRAREEEALLGDDDHPLAQ